MSVFLPALKDKEKLLIEEIHDELNFHVGAPVKRIAERHITVPNNWRRL